MKTAFFLMILLCGSTFAQNIVTSTSATSELQISRDESGVKSCGVRTVVVYDDVQKKNKLRAIDFSLNIYSNFTTLIKFGAIDFKEKPKEIVHVSRQNTIQLSLPSEDLNLTGLTPIPAESIGYTLANAGDPETVIKLIYAIVKGNNLQINVPRKSESISMTVRFAAPLSKLDNTSFDECFQGLMKNLEKNSDK